VPVDRVLGTIFGHKALGLLVSGHLNELVVMQEGKLNSVPLKEVAGKQRLVPLDHPLLAAARAVGSAVGANPLAWIIPCHRVIQQAGEPGGYRWGTVTKQAMIGFEAVRLQRPGSSSQIRQIHVNA